MNKFILSLASSLTGLGQAQFNPSEPAEIIEDITFDKDGLFEEDWRFAVDEFPLKPGEMFSCKDNFEKIEWELQSLTGSVFYMAVGTDKQVYAISRTERMQDGNALLRYDNKKENWKKINKGAKQVAVDQDGSIWIVNALQHVYRGKAGQWTRIFGKATAISVGGDGSVFILGNDKKTSGYEIYKLSKDSLLWQKFPGRAMRIAVDNKGNPWIISSQQKIYRYSEEGWMKLAGRQFKQIMSGHDGSMYALDGTKQSSGYGIWKYNFEQQDWQQINGRAFFLAIGFNGTPYAISQGGTVYWPPESCLYPIRMSKPKKYVTKVFEPCRSYRRVIWQKQGGDTNDIGVGSNGAIWALGDKVDGTDGFQIKRWTGQSWEIQKEVVGNRIAVDNDGNPWIVQKQGDILRYEEGTFVNVPGKARDISIGVNGQIYSIGWLRHKKGYEVNKWDGGQWTKTDHYGFRVAVDVNGEPWVVTRRHKIFRKVGKKWNRVRGQLDDIAIGPEGSIIGVRRKRGVWKFNLKKNKWYKIGKYAANVAVGPGGRPFITTSKGTIFWAEPECPDKVSTISSKVPSQIGEIEFDSEATGTNQDLIINDDEFDDILNTDFKEP